MNTRRLRSAIVLALPLALSLVACSGEDTTTVADDESVSVGSEAPDDLIAGQSATPTYTAPETGVEPASSVATEAPDADDTDVIVTDIFADANAGQPWLDAVVSVTRTQSDRIEVVTTIVDPRGADGSQAALQAVAVCEAAVAHLEMEGVSSGSVAVYEDDGTTFVVYGHPSYPGGCIEV